MKIATKTTIAALIARMAASLRELGGAVNTVVAAMPSFLRKTDAAATYQPKGDYLLSSQLQDLKGPKGDKGDKGDTGAQGPQGSKGDTGATGAAGHSPVVSVSSDGYLTVDGVKQTARSLVGPQGAKGNTGDRGYTGAQGPQGATGATGATGPTGPKGDKGDKGAVFTPKVDSSGNLSWSNNGGLTNPAAVNIKGPKGDTGAQGPKGATGATGPQGPAGSNATVTKAAIEAVLTGVISTHSHAVPSTVALKDFSNVSQKSMASTSGYYKFPDGLMFQWGKIQNNSDSNFVQTVYFPTTFYNTSYTVLTTTISAYQEYYVGRTVCHQATNYFRVSANQKNREEFFYMAIGRWK